MGVGITSKCEVRGETRGSVLFGRLGRHFESWLRLITFIDY